MADTPNADNPKGDNSEGATPEVDTPKAAWPKTDEGTTDWEVVFEDTDTGFIALTSQAQSAAALKMSATVIIEKLFTRKNDAFEREQLIYRLNDIITQGDGDTDVMRQGVAALMRSIKDERIEKARVYIERKHAGAAIDRRAGLLWKINMLLHPAVLIPVGGLFVAILAGLVFWMLQSTLTPETEETDGVAQVEQPAEASGEEDAAEDGVEQPQVKPDPFPIDFKTLRWPLATKYTKDRPQYYSVSLFVLDWDHKIEICRRLPTVTDRFYQSFSQAMPLDRAAREEEVEALEDVIQNAINRILPDKYVKNVEVARYGTKEFRAAVRAPYCKAKKPERAVEAAKP